MAGFIQHPSASGSH